ncbi:hypothetical protein FO519_003451 [Halicephalobus sp. NKZ332]|nr:hypothetical protein FO519_003451 [Halicephalobus sp. NKZ332]
MSGGFLSKAKMHAKTIVVVTVFLSGGYGVFWIGKKIQGYTQGTPYRIMEEMDDFTYNKELNSRRTASRNQVKMKNILIFLSFVAVVHGACNLASEETKFAKLYKKNYLKLLTLKQAKTLVKNMESFLVNASAGDMGTLYESIINGEITLLSSANQAKYKSVLAMAGNELGSEDKVNTLLGQVKTAVVTVATPFFTNARKVASQNANADIKTKSCLCIQAFGPYFNNVNTNVTMSKIKQSANAADLMKFLVFIFILSIGYALGQDQLTQCRAELENVHNEATLQIKNLTDIIQDYIDGIAKNASLGDVLKQKMQATAADIKSKWNSFADNVKQTFSNLGGTITNTWQNIFGNPTTVIPTVRPGVTVPPSLPTSSPSFWDKVRNFFG